MRVLQLDVDRIAYQLIKPESSVYEQSEDKSVSIDDAVAMLISIESGDNDGIAAKAVDDTVDYMRKNKRQRLVVYPFAHLSNDLAKPDAAMRLIALMADKARASVEVKKAPFGWNKKLSIDIKGHPLAEQARSYGDAAAAAATKRMHERPRVNTAIVRKSDWSGLPESDHRTIGERLDLYSFQEVSPAMVYWHPNGYVIYKQLVAFIREKEDAYGYREISTPDLANMALWHMSGHDEHYRDNMFHFESQLGEVGLKPMNCPSSILIYKSRKWSYRELPFRTATFDKLFRSELSGVASGLFRVKELTQDDGHIFVREDQVEAELTGVINMVREVYGTFGLKFTAKLSTMPDDHAGDDVVWEKATAQLKSVLKANGMEYELKEKEGSFYAPKIDFDVFDSQGRAWQCATIQLDYQMPLKFGIEYTGEDGKAHMPVIIHRAILGSMERFIGVMVEHYQGKFPVWLAPVQARVITISEQSSDYARGVFGKLKAAGIRAEIDDGDRTLEYKVRDAQMQKIPYMIVIGKREAEGSAITVRDRNGKQKPGMRLDDFVQVLKAQIEARSGELLQ
jgi:threonyl-tRNA synthetase